VAVLAVVGLLLPVPWLHVVSDDPLGTAWRLDGRLEVEGETIDPPGRWTWLAVGRPQLVVEVVRDRLVGADQTAANLRDGPAGRRPSMSEPAAAAIGLRQAGQDVAVGVTVEVRRPLLDGYPETGFLDTVDGTPLADRQTWEAIAGSWSGEEGSAQAADAAREGSRPGLTFRFRNGQRYSAPGPGLPYTQVLAYPSAPEGFEAGIRFAIQRLLPDGWFRDLSLGSSHALMVALSTYAHASGVDLAQGRHIAGTGGLLGDGTVTRIGGLPSKARAANRAGADILLVPATQAQEVATMRLEGTHVVPVASLEDAIGWLARPPG
jgi:hypothetical protein